MPDEGKVVHSRLDWQELESRIRERTPARLLEGRSGASYRTATQLALRADHAAARDAVQTELDLNAHFSREFVRRWELFEISTLACSKSEYLLRPDLGRTLGEAARSAVTAQCPRGPDVQIAVGDGLSVSAVAAQVEALLPLLYDGARARNWAVGRTFVVRYCRVGVMNHIGELLAPSTVVLLIGERPGLATAESLSAYLAYCPRPGHTDADRNLVSNIHGRGVPVAKAATRILNLVGQMLKERTSGTHVKERFYNQQAR
jgi:ethanolamine ammonia-lyase small subunit